MTKIVASPQQAVIVRSRYCSSDTEDAISRDWRFLVQSGASPTTVCKIQVWTVGTTNTHTPALFKIYSRDAAHIAAERCVVVPAETFVSTIALTRRAGTPSVVAGLSCSDRGHHVPALTVTSGGRGVGFDVACSGTPGGSRTPYAVNSTRIFLINSNSNLYLWSDSGAGQA